MNLSLPPLSEDLKKIAQDNRRTRLVHIAIFFGHCLNTMWIHSNDSNVYVIGGVSTCILLGALWLHRDE